MNDPLAWIDAEADAWSRKGLERRLVALGAATPGRIVRAGRTLLNFASNDYLGLANDPRVDRSRRPRRPRTGTGGDRGPLAAGLGLAGAARGPRAALAEFEGVEAVALFADGLRRQPRGDHRPRRSRRCGLRRPPQPRLPLIDGARLAGARLRVYPHNDADRLESILSRDRGRFRRSLIATDGVFSMDGDLAPLADLADLADRFGAILLVDEAHGTGVFGATGRGAAEAAGLDPGRVPVKVGTLSKALGLDRRVRRGLEPPDRLAPQSCPPPDLLDRTPRRRRRRRPRSPPRSSSPNPTAATQLRTIAAHLRAGLADRGVPVDAGSGPIVPILLGRPEAATGLGRSAPRRRLPGPRDPSPHRPRRDIAPPNQYLTAAHTAADVERPDRGASRAGETSVNFSPANLNVACDRQNGSRASSQICLP